MSSIKQHEDLKAQMRGFLSTAAAIAKSADDAGRPLTQAERLEVSKNMKAAQALRPKVEAGEADYDLAKQIRDFGNSIGLGGGAGAFKASTRPGEKQAHAGSQVGSWSEAFVKAATDSVHGFKGLIAAGSVAVPTAFDAIPVRDGERANFVRQLLPNIPLEGTDRFAYMRQTVRTNNAATVAAGARKPTSIFTLEKIEDRARTIAHLSEPIHRSDLADAASLSDFVQAELLYGLMLASDDEIVNGDGSTVGGLDRLTGLLETAGIITQAWDTNLLVTTRKAITVQENLTNTPTAWVLNPSDWERFDLLRTDEGGAGTGEFLLHDGVDLAKRTLWGLPVVTTPVIAAGVGLLGDFVGGARVRPREQARVDWSENVYRPDALGVGDGASDWERNMVSFRGEERVGLEVLRPSAFTELDLTAA